MPHGWTKDYNRAERLLWQDAERILAEAGLTQGATMVDLGCGDGFFTIAAAKIVGPGGLIYAVDASPEAISALNSNLSASGLNNVRVAIADAETFIACEHCADLVLLANVLHDFEKPLKVMANARTMLKPGGTLADLDWKKEPQQQHGPPFPKRLSQDEAAAIFTQAGFKTISRTLSGPFHYLLLAKAI
jgi:ubiquinone/menaquinone biosynthesis C-methylase UbiE